MAARKNPGGGRPKEFHFVVEVAMTTEQVNHVDRIAAMTGLSRAAVIRGMVQDRLDIASGRFSPYPEILDDHTKSVLEQGK